MFSVFFIALLVITGIPSVAADGTVTESFTTTTYKDPATTAEGWGTGSISSPRSYSITQLDHYVTTKPIRGLDVQGSKAYIVVYDPASSISSNRILNISDPTDITLMSSRDSFTKFITGLVDGDIFYGGRNATSGIGAISFYNVSNPNGYGSVSGVYLGSVTVDGSVTDIDIQGHFLYATAYDSSGSRAFVVIDIQDPTSPVRIPNNWSSMTTLGVDVEGYYAFLAESHYGLWVCNVSNPYAVTQPSPGYIDTPGNATAVLVDGGIAYVADGPSGIQIVDISDPSAPVIIGSADTPGNAVKLAMQGNTLFVADRTGGVQVFDVSTPTSPVAVANIAISDAYEIDLMGGVLVIGASDGVYTYSVGSLVTDFTLVGTYNTYHANDVAIQGNIAYVAAGADGLVVLDVSDPTNPILLDRIWQGATIDYTTVDVQGQFAYVTNWGSSNKGLNCFDISDPSNVVFRDYVGFTYPYDVTVAGDVAYVADGLWGLYLMNISNPYNLVYIDDIDMMENATALMVQGHFAYVVGGGSIAGEFGQHNYNLNGFNLQFTDGLQWTDAEDIAVSGDFAVIANGLSGLNFVNITDPWNIINADYDPLPGDTYCTAVTIFGTTVFSGERGFGLRCIDASNVNEIQLVSSYSTGNPDVRSLTIGGDYLYAACGNQLLIFRIFRSAGNTYESTTIAQSLSLYTSTTQITQATLTSTSSVPTGTSIEWFMSVDGGVNWESVTPGIAYTFTNTGNDIRWRVSFTTINDDRTPSVSFINIDFIEPPPIPGFPAIAITLGVISALGIGVISRRRQRKP